MNIAIVQLNSKDNKKDNLNHAKEFIEQCASEGADTVCLPETFNWLGPDREKPDNSEPIPGATSDFLSALAQKHSIYIHTGSILEKSEYNDKCYNTTLFMDPQGEIIAKYRKIHLFDALIKDKAYSESEYVLSGKDIVSVEAEHIRFGFSICYDLRFPELYRKLSEQDADIIFSPSAFTVPTGQAHWHTLIRARAIENQVFMTAPAQVGTDADGKTYYGHSLIVDPWGTVIAEMDDESEGYIVADCDIEKLNEIREKLPVLKHRKIKN